MHKRSQLRYRLLAAAVLCLLPLTLVPQAQGQASLAPVPCQQFLDNNGKPLSGGFVYTYVSASNTPLATYTDVTGNTQNTNPVVLDAGGYATNGSVRTCLWLGAGSAYRIKVTDKNNVQQYLVDGVAGIVSSTGSIFSASTTVSFSSTPTFSASGQYQLFKMTLTGNVTSSTLDMSGVTAPALVSFEWTQDSTGSRTVAYPANVLGADAVNGGPNVVTSQTFWFDGTNAQAVGSATISNSTPGITGEVKFYAGSAAPAGWYFCDGSAKSRTSDAALFKIIGTTFGAGDGSTTFNIPDDRGRAFIGAGQGSGLTNRALAATGGEENHTLQTSEMPVHTHSVTDPGHSHGLGPGSFNGGLTAGANAGIQAAGGASTATATTGISLANAGGGGSHNTMMPYLVVNCMVKR